TALAPFPSHVDKRPRSLPASLHREHSAAVEPTGKAFECIQRRKIARRQPPQHTEHAHARRGRDRAVALRDQVAPVAQQRWPERVRTWTTLVHRGALHVGAIGKVERHGTRLRKPVQMENRSETIPGRNAIRIRPFRMVVNTPKSGLNTMAIRKSTSSVVA